MERWLHEEAASSGVGSCRNLDADRIDYLADILLVDVQALKSWFSVLTIRVLCHTSKCHASSRLGVDAFRLHSKYLHLCQSHSVLKAKWRSPITITMSDWHVLNPNCYVIYRALKDS